MSDSFQATVHMSGLVDINAGLFRKTISIADYASVIDRMVEESDSQEASSHTVIRTPTSMHSMATHKDGYIINLYYPGREVELEHNVEGKKKMYMPNVMIRVGLNKVVGNERGGHALGDIRWFATDKTPSQLPTEWPTYGNDVDHIWKLPMLNMFSDARMCLGGNRLPSVIYHDWTVLDMLYNDILIGSKFNNDLSVPSVPSRLDGPKAWFNYLHRQWLEEDTTEFPYSILTNY